MHLYLLENKCLVVLFGETFLRFHEDFFLYGRCYLFLLHNKKNTNVSYLLASTYNFNVFLYISTFTSLILKAEWKKIPSYYFMFAFPGQLCFSCFGLLEYFAFVLCIDITAVWCYLCCIHTSLLA